MTTTSADVRKACIELWDCVPPMLRNGGHNADGFYVLRDILSELGTLYSSKLAEWYNCTSIDIFDVQHVANVAVRRFLCDNCGEAEFRCTPPNDDWSHFQGCQNPAEVGLLFELPRDEVFICTVCCNRNGAFGLIAAAG